MMFAAPKPFARPTDAVGILRARQSARERMHAAIPARYSPWLHLGATLSIGVIVLAVAVPRVHSPTRGWLFLVTAAIYVVGYEVSHMSYHLPPDSFIGRLWLVQWLREHHRQHHHARLMQKWNFNVTIPLFDWIHRTTASKALI